MNNSAMFGVVSSMMKYIVDGNINMAISICKKILEELEKRKESIG